MSEEALEAAAPGKKKYTLDRYLEFMDLLQARAAQLAEDSGGEN
jgi:hypothetical protein